MTHKEKENTESLKQQMRNFNTETDNPRPSPNKATKQRNINKFLENTDLPLELQQQIEQKKQKTQLKQRIKRLEKQRNILIAINTVAITTAIMSMFFITIFIL